MSTCSCCGISDSICSCGSVTHPSVIYNAPNQPAISYRVGDFAAFRAALLQSLPNETELSSTQGNVTTQIWQPTGHGDLALQMMEWWAYLADILTFYNQRIATQAYLGTADLPESVNSLVAILGYRPRPGIGATGTVAALSNTPLPFIVPKGFAIQSKPGPDQPPQIFELIADATVGSQPTGPVSPSLALGAIAIHPAADSTQPLIDPSALTFTLAGISSAVKKGDQVLILPGNPTSSSPFALGSVMSVTPGKDPSLGPITTIQLGSNINPSNGVSSLATSGPLTLYAAGQATQVWQYDVGSGSVVNAGAGTIDLQSIVRTININDPVVIQSDSNFYFSTVASTSEVVWYANPDPSDPSVPPASNTNNLVIAIPITHTRITLGSASFLSTAALTPATTFVWNSWKMIAGLIALPPTTVGSSDPSAQSSTTLQPSAGEVFPPLSASGATPTLVVDSVGAGATGQISSGSVLALDNPVPLLIPPLRAFFNLLSVTRGKTVSSEVLGSGNATIAGQDFILKNSPVTYLRDPKSVSGNDYSSTVTVWVNGLQWQEVQSFYGQSSNDKVFITQEDPSGKTHVLFGDGIYGARVPTGTDNVTASYRYGSGAAAPAAGSLTVVLKPQPGLRAIVNPVAVGGGSDPDPPGKLKQLAPKSVLTFGRAVSLDDFQVIAANTPGVTRAAAAFGFDPVSQRPQVTVYVGDNQGAVLAAQRAIAAAADPNRLPAVRLANQVSIIMALSIAVNPDYQSGLVEAAVTTALVDPDSGLFGVNNVAIGQVFYDSQIYRACLAVPGVLAVHNLSLSLAKLEVIEIPIFQVPLLEEELSASSRVAVLAGTSSLELNKNIERVEELRRIGNFRRPIELRRIKLQSPYSPGADSYYFVATDGSGLSVNVEAS